eukprot:CAMPEP_0170168760 /NCGR_PEP_ID=MMETSP0040_2-20121228/1708_1 /TAXON_ID=641309 /ORGANISM="Lotharella oceanica, Strain CCMP622" /LENGTH=289 /DNA_ID=CAMNT_0010407103 /DNA_START=193 /DNA_END=1062 /DNA_ORIENTATION=-
MFPMDELVEQTNSSGVPNCDGCPDGKTLIYDHCKNHPEFVDVGLLPAYPQRACGENPIQIQDCVDDVANLFDDRVYLFRPTHDRCYLKGAVENVRNLYAQIVKHPANQVKFVNDQPFPHCLPRNNTPYFNHSDPAGFDGPGECLRWVYPGLTWAGKYKEENIFTYDQTLYVNDTGVGIRDKGFIYIPDVCKPGQNGPDDNGCKMVVAANNCDHFGDGDDPDWAMYGETNGIVVLKPCVGGYVDKERFPRAVEVQRGLLDVYGQLGDDYVMQKAPHMKLVGELIKAVTGW